MGINPFGREGHFSLRDLQSEFDRMMDRLWHGSLSTPPLDGQDWAPPIDVTEEADRFVARLEVPGLTSDAVDVSVLDRVVTIHGTKPAPPKLAEGQRSVAAECRYGSFRREIQLPVPVAADRVVATCRHGVLEIVLPKQESARGRPVKVETCE